MFHLLGPCEGFLQYGGVVSGRSPQKSAVPTEWNNLTCNDELILREKNPYIFFWNNETNFDGKFLETFEKATGYF